MKKTDKMSRVVGALERMYNIVNEEIFLPRFGQKLPKVIITVQTGKGKSYGHSTVKKVWTDGENSTYELNIASEFLSHEIECTLDTMIHEMVHIYCRENEIQEVSRGGFYHNKKFKELAEKAGLKCVLLSGAGWNTDHRGNDFLLEFAIDHDFSELAIERKMQIDFSSLFGNGGTKTPESKAPESKAPETRTSSTIKYKCECCGVKIRATKDLDGQLKHFNGNDLCGMFIRF